MCARRAVCACVRVCVRACVRTCKTPKRTSGRTGNIGNRALAPSLSWIWQSCIHVHVCICVFARVRVRECSHRCEESQAL